jgi:hypothetical protein
MRERARGGRDFVYDRLLNEEIAGADVVRHGAELLKGGNFFKIPGLRVGGG